MGSWARLWVVSCGLLASGAACGDPKADNYSRETARYGGPLGAGPANPGVMTDYSNYTPAPFDPITGPAEPAAIEKPDAGQDAAPPSADPAVSAVASAFEGSLREIERMLGAGNVEGVVSLIQPDQVAALTPEKRAFLGPTFEKWSLVRKAAAPKLGEGGDARLDQLLSGRPEGGFAITPINTETATVTPNPLALAIGGGDNLTLEKKDGVIRVQFAKAIDDAAVAAAAERHRKLQAALDTLLEKKADWEGQNPDEIVQRIRAALGGG